MKQHGKKQPFVSTFFFMKMILKTPFFALICTLQKKNAAGPKTRRAEFKLLNPVISCLLFILKHS